MKEFSITLFTILLISCNIRSASSKNKNDTLSQVYDLQNEPTDTINKTINFIKNIDSLCLISQSKEAIVFQSQYSDTNTIKVYFRENKLLRLDFFIPDDSGISNKSESYYFENNRLIGHKIESKKNSEYGYGILSPTKEMVFGFDNEYQTLDSWRSYFSLENSKINIAVSSYKLNFYMSYFDSFKYSNSYYESAPILESFDELKLGESPQSNTKTIEIIPSESVNIIYLDSKIISQNGKNQLWHKIQFNKKNGWVLEDQTKLSLRSKLW